MKRAPKIREKAKSFEYPSRFKVILGASFSLFGTLTGSNPRDSNTLLIAERLQLIQLLNGLPSVQLEELIFALNPPGGTVPEQGNRVAALLGWVEGTTGPGLQTLKETLNLFPDIPSLASSPSIEARSNKGAPNSAVVLNGENQASIEDAGWNHLLVAVFWQERSRQKIRITPRLCYRNQETQEILQESLVEDATPSISLSNFPIELDGLIRRAIHKLQGRYVDSLQPWELVIELFVPADLLCSSLSVWCGQNADLLRRHCIVIGCSDRFDPSRRDQDVIDLHNQLKRGWQRFQTRVPDRERKPLTNLAWLDSNQAEGTSLLEFSGFRCYGDWLKPDEQSLDNWMELVKSGIPLALWVCGKTPEPRDINQISQNFTRLINHTRFDFLDYIRVIRDEQYGTSQHYLGVFYEDLNYAPRPGTEGRFRWPGAAA